MNNFVHLRVHTEYSLVDSLLRVDALVDAVAEQRMPACAITDQGNVSALVKFYKPALSRGVKPIVGADIWVAESLEDREPSRLTLLVPEPRRFQAAERAADQERRARSARRPQRGPQGLARAGGARRAHRAVGRAARRARQSARGRPRHARLGGPRPLAEAAAGPLLHRAATTRPCRRARVPRARSRGGGRACRAGRRDQRRVLPRAQRLRSARDARLHRPGRHARRSRSSARRTAKSSICARRPRWPSCSRICPRRSRTPSRSPGAARSRSTSVACILPDFVAGRSHAAARVSRAACRERARPALRRARHRTRRRAALPRAARARDRGHLQDGLRGLLPHRRRLHRAGRARTPFPSDRVAAPASARSSPMRSASRTSTRSRTISCSNGS